MRKTAVMVLVVLAISAASAAALEVGIGAGYRYEFAGTTNFAAIWPMQQHTAWLDLRAWPYPLQLGIGISHFIVDPPAGMPFGYESAILTADWRFVDAAIGTLPLAWHLGAGVWLALPGFGAGIRGTIGLRWMPIPEHRQFEVFLEIVPSIGGLIVPSPAFSAGASAGLGVRYWFGR